jgi:hypothetical protein
MQQENIKTKTNKTKQKMETKKSQKMIKEGEKPFSRPKDHF